MLDDLGHPRVRRAGRRARRVDRDRRSAHGGDRLVSRGPAHPARPLDADDRSRCARGAAGFRGLIDARAPERYRGDVEPVDAVPGHIPTAVSLPTAGNLGPDGRFLEPEVLRARFAALGDEVVSYCGSGVNACHNVLGDAGGRAARPAPLPGVLQRLGRNGDADRDGRRTGDHFAFRLSHGAGGFAGAGAANCSGRLALGVHLDGGRNAVRWGLWPAPGARRASRPLGGPTGAPTADPASAGGRGDSGEASPAPRPAARLPQLSGRGTRCRYS